MFGRRNTTPATTPYTGNLDPQKASDFLDSLEARRTPYTGNLDPAKAAKFLDSLEARRNR